MLVGYARVSTLEQNTAAQLAAFHRAGIVQVVQEKRSAVKDRPELVKLLRRLQPGDTLVVYKLDRLSRSLLDFTKLMEVFDARKVAFVSITQKFDTSSSMGRLMLHILLSFAQFEREMIAERTRDKMSAARRKGKWVGGMLNDSVQRPTSSRLGRVPSRSMGASCASTPAGVVVTSETATSRQSLRLAPP